MSTKLRNTSTVLLFLDAEKAFNRIEWKYMFYAFTKFGFEGNFQAWRTLLYSDQSAFILNEGQESEKIIFHHGVRQGCPISQLFFALDLEPLVTGFREHSEELKIALYADDIVCFSENPLSSLKNYRGY